MRKDIYQGKKQESKETHTKWWTEKDGKRKQEQRRAQQKGWPLTCCHNACRGHGHHGDVLRGVGRMKVRPDRSHLGATTTTTFLLGAPSDSSGVHGDGARHGEHSRGVVGGRGVRERGGLLWAQLLLHLV